VVSGLNRGLGDKLRGKIIVKIRGLHRSQINSGPKSNPREIIEESYAQVKIN